MARSKTDYGMKKRLGTYLEAWCDENGFEYTHPSEFQWNIKVPQIQVLIAVYPGSGMMYLPYAHYTGLGVIDKSGQKLYFHDEKSLEKELFTVLFATDAV